MRYLIPAMIASALLVPGGAAFAQNSSQTHASKASDHLTIERDASKGAMIDLRSAVRSLRQASVVLLNEKKPSDKRQKAFQDAQDAIKKAQLAMSKLPPSMQTAIKHDAKDWPAVAARLDRAASALETAVNNLSSQSGDQQKQAARNAQSALNDVKDAVHDLPNWQVGANEK